MTERTPLPGKKYKLSINMFVLLMVLVIAVQGTYLGYVVGMLTTLEKRFGFSSEKSGWLLSLYDIGHTMAILLIGYIGSHYHLPRITGIGVLLSSLSMFMLALPVLFYGTADYTQEQLLQKKEAYAMEMSCDLEGRREISSQGEDCWREHSEHTNAFIILAFGQLFAGIFAAPFNTIAYVYIDSNVKQKRESPFLLGLLTSMYAFGPALGFLLSSILNGVYTTLGDAPDHIGTHDEHWIGAWWLGFLFCGTAYLLLAVPFFFFPRTYKHPDSFHLMLEHSRPEVSPEDRLSFKENIELFLREFPMVLKKLLSNKVYITMVIAWMFGSYLIGGYQTYLPKFIETQYGRSASMADIYSGIISVGAIAVSTALGGWILSRYNIAPRSSIICLIGSWVVILVSYIVGMNLGCSQPKVEGLSYVDYADRWHFYHNQEREQECLEYCNCETVLKFDGVSSNGHNFYSPCHAGCTNYDPFSNTWSNCQCVYGSAVDKGLVHPECDIFFAYLAVMMIGLFIGNLFFMVTMMIVLRSVFDEEKVIALSLASFITNLFGFIPAPVIYGFFIDLCCILWNRQCPNERGNCVLYDNDKFSKMFHGVNGFFQIFAIIFAGICYWVSKSVKLPEEMPMQEFPESREREYRDEDEE
uniref:Solute carrier organic anion transporter family member n=1 Tax=Caenorhabditis tropicalis TaxID=1561998 RepID=A0A1I7U0H2_9PELO